MEAPQLGHRRRRQLGRSGQQQRPAHAPRDRAGGQRVRELLAGGDVHVVDHRVEGGGRDGGRGGEAVGPRQPLERQRRRDGRRGRRAHRPTGRRGGGPAGRRGGGQVGGRGGGQV